LLQAQHAAKNTISTHESMVTSLKSLLKSQATLPPPIEHTPTEQPEPIEPVPLLSESLTQMLTNWEKTVQGQWSSVRKEWASECEQLASARKEWESKVKAVETNLRTPVAKFESGLVSLTML
jgi:hypothetical protein